MKRVLIVGSGDVACRAIPWLAKRFVVFALTRSSDASDSLRSLGARPMIADLDDRDSLRRLAGIADVVLHFAPPPRKGGQDTRTQRLLACLASRESLPQRIVYISTTGVYGDCGGELVTETRPCRPRTGRALRRVDAERRLRRFGIRNRVRVSILRAPGIYAGDRLPIERLRRADPVLRVDEDVYTNHIHAEDLARLACISIFRGRPGRVYNAVDESGMRMGDYFEFAADALGMPRPPRMSRVDLSQRISPMALSFMSESRRITSRRLRSELRIELRYPTVRDGFAAALNHQGDPA